MVTQFHYTAWPENDSPRSTADFLNMVDQLQKWQQAIGDKVITIHCKYAVYENVSSAVPWNGFCVFSNGVGRSGAFCGLLTLIEILKMETAIDFFHKVKAMRIQRPGMVQTVVRIDIILSFHQFPLSFV